MAKLSLTKRTTFLASFLVGVLVSTAPTLWRSAYFAQRLHPLGQSLSVTSQLSPNDLAVAHAKGYQSVIDLRPDGEEPGEPTSSQMEFSAIRSGLAFHYVPVPHGTIPNEAVEALGKALNTSQGPVLLYCHSGRRAVRTWSLYEASRPKGLSVPEILAAARNAGQSADDLQSELKARAAARTMDGGR